tara:strand:+ start:399 stop:683 length:285 start_codon:yes stop_codon:yes gene_type:complete
MDINNLDGFAATKKAEGKRVAIYDGTDYYLEGTVAVVDYESGYVPLANFKTGEYVNLDQVTIDAWNKKQGLTDAEVEMLIDQSCRRVIFKKEVA